MNLIWSKIIEEFFFYYEEEIEKGWKRIKVGFEKLGYMKLSYQTFFYWNYKFGWLSIDIDNNPLKIIGIEITEAVFIEWSCNYRNLGMQTQLTKQKCHCKFYYQQY